MSLKRAKQPLQKHRRARARQVRKGCSDDSQESMTEPEQETTLVSCFSQEVVILISERSALLRRFILAHSLIRHSSPRWERVQEAWQSSGQQKPEAGTPHIPQDREAATHAGARIYLIFFPFHSVWVSSSWHGAGPVEDGFSSRVKILETLSYTPSGYLISVAPIHGETAGQWDRRENQESHQAAQGYFLCHDRWLLKFK